MIGAEGSDGKTSPPFWHPSFDSSEVIFGSDLLKCRRPLVFLHKKNICVDKYAKFAGSAYFANLLFCLACGCLPKLAILAA